MNPAQNLLVDGVDTKHKKKLNLTNECEVYQSKKIAHTLNVILRSLLHLYI